ncbi:MAG: cytochrome c [Steroidobacteraceae bacterium]|nr:cytochrome c [Steroidobacteraceae bacterium]
MNARILAYSAAAVLGAAVVAAVYLGAFDVAADSPHWRITSNALTLIRDRSVAVRAAGTKVPDLADADLIALGAEHYDAMCTGCHLAPGVTNSELRQGLYPEPPNLVEPTQRTPAEQFWIIKHGIKMSGMPAWGASHDDDSIWGLVAFVRQLPNLGAADYRSLTGRDVAGTSDQERHEHDDDHAAAASGITMEPAAEAAAAHDHGAGHEH